MKTLSRRRILRVPSVFVLLAALLAGLVGTAPVAAAAEAPSISTAISLVTSTGPTGLKHPAIGVTAPELESTRAKLLAGQAPWTDYYSAMLSSSFASRTLRSANLGSSDTTPADARYDDASDSSRLWTDAEGAYTQAVLYYFTGDAVYRENALRILRVWENMNPSGYVRYPDSYIKTGIVFYKLVAAAELIRSSTFTQGASSYPLEWSAQDQAKLSDNFIVPMTESILHDNSYYMNQFSIPLLGAMAGYIFRDDRARYDESVEWFTVNSTAPDPAINGALTGIFREIPADAPYNTYGYSFVQHQEMARDQAHGGGDVNILTALARVVDSQGTKVDPEDGTASTAADAVSPYAFKDYRLLRGVNQFVGFMMGYDVPFVDITGGPAKLSQWYRGRWSDSLSELYNIYARELGVDVATIAPYVAQQHEQQDPAMFYNFPSLEIGTAVSGDTDGRRTFWGGSMPGAEYWLALPDAASADVIAPQNGSPVTFEQKGSVISGDATAVDSGAVLRVMPGEDGTVVAVRSLVYGPRISFSPVGVRVRTTEPATLEVSRLPDVDPYQTVTIPDTEGQWRWISYDMNQSVVPLPEMGDNHLAYYAFTSSCTSSDADCAIDLDKVDVQAGDTLTPPVFDRGASTTVIGVQGQALSADLSAKDPGGSLAYTGHDLPSGAVLNGSTGALTLTPNAPGTSRLVVQADDGTTGAALAVTIEVVADRPAAIARARAAFDEQAVYTSTTRTAYDSALAAADALVASGSSSAFDAALLELQEATAALALLSPRASDGSLDYVDIATSSIGSAKLGNLLDFDAETFSGDLSVDSMTLDFGTAYRVRADAFSLQARYLWGSRLAGTAVYGSNDNVTWTKLTPASTTNTNANETLAVAQEHRDSSFRFLKLQDSNFSGILSVGEFRIDGERVEAASAVSSATITSSNSSKGRAANGDTVTLSFTTSQDVTDVRGTIEGAAATISGGPRSWTATAVLPADVTSGRPVAFSIGYRLADGTSADPLVVTSDGSTLFLSNETTMIRGLPGIVDTINSAGELDPSRASQIAKTFDGDRSTFSDIGQDNGAFAAILDTREGGSIALSRVELQVRQDSWGTSRAGRLHLEGSNDLTTWTTLTGNATATLDWQTLAVSSTSAFRYLKIANGDWINIAELRLFGTHVAPPASFIATSTLTSSNSVPKLAVAGDTVTLAITGTEPLAGVRVTLAGVPAAVTGSGTAWSASAVVPATAALGSRVASRVEYTTAGGAAGRPSTTTTDGSTVTVSTGDRLISDLPSRVTTIGLTGTAETAKTVHLQRMTDSVASTFSDIGAVGGAYYLVMDAGEDENFDLERVELLVRQDSNGTSRASSLHLEASTDLTSWTTITTSAKGTLAWQELALTNADPAPFRYLRIANNTWINIAEIRLFGAIAPLPDPALATSAISTGSPQTVEAGTAIAARGIEAHRADGSPAAGRDVLFTVDGAARFTDGGTTSTSTTDASGRAEHAPLTAAAEPGEATVTATVDGISVTLPTVTVTAKPAAPMVSAAAHTEIVKKKVVLVVAVTNPESAAVSAVVRTAHGTTTIESIAPGATESVTIPTKKKTVPAGAATVVITRPGEADRTLTAPYDAR